MTTGDILDSIEAKHLYNDSQGTHLCDKSEVHKGIVLVWTLCGQDVPANRSFRSFQPEEDATCKHCLAILETLKGIG